MKNMFLMATLVLLVSISARADRELEFSPAKILAAKVINHNGPESLRIYGKDFALPSKVKLGNIILDEIVEWNDQYIEVKLPNSIIPATYLLTVESKVQKGSYHRKWARMAITVGAIGPRGRQGYTGPMGATGAQGQQGLMGPQGPKGEMGAQGEKGAMGEAGIKPSELNDILLRLKVLEDQLNKENKEETTETETNNNSDTNNKTTAIQ